ncbi:MAG: hypothetical protein KKF68_02130 [Nanoarchaeota archaeon]|nr:hypothetical protein [Nanoarchaeota archaeon]
MEKENLNQTENEEIETDVEVLEISLNDLEIEELITKLQLLKESKEPVQFEIDSENELVIHYDDETDSDLNGVGREE